MRDQEGKHCRAEGEVNQIPGKPVCRLLDWSARAFRIFDCLNDLAEGRLFPQTFRADLERARLVDGSCVNVAASQLFAGHRLAGDRGLFHKRMTAEHPAIHRNSATRSNDDHVPRQNHLRVHFDDLILSEHAGSLRKKIQHVLNRAASAPDRESFEDLRCENERSDDQRGEKLANRKRGKERDGHGEFHCHAALKNVLKRLFEDGVASNQRGNQANDADAVKGLPEMEPDCRCRQRNKGHAKDFDDL